ncbi:hypothetical protein GC170_02365 [bacterium]|nr:hypothetical protein [bacterium]
MRRQDPGHRIILRFAPLLAGLIAWSGCGVEKPQTAKSRRPTGVITRPGTSVTAGSATTIELADTANAGAQAPDAEQQAAILDSVLNLLSKASSNPGGDNFTIATEQLNQYFNRNATAIEFNLSPPAFQFLTRLGMPEKNMTEFTKKLQEPKFSIMDARHIEDCMMYSTLANRIAGNGDDMTRLRRIFEWVSRQVMVVPARSLAPPGMNQQAQARPFDCILRGMATEADPSWAERTWVFMSLARQIRIDVGILVSSRDPAQWLSVAIVEGKPYLFDCRTGLEVKTADGQRVATLEEAITDPRILQAMQLPGGPTYGPTTADLATGELSILADMSTSYLSPRMRLLEQRLAGKNRMILFRDVAELETSFMNAVKPRVKEVRIWDLPFTVESLLFTNPEFVNAAQYPLRIFDFKLPVLAARTAQLRGETADALEKYATMRFAENALMRDKITPIPPDVQKVIDLYSTYFLALCHLDNSLRRTPREAEQREADLKQARFFFNESLRLYPDPSPERPFFYMFRWNAFSNLGLLALDAGDEANAVRFLAAPQPTTQGYGNSLLASNLVWADPFRPAPAALPPAPEDKLAPSQEALRAAAAAREASAAPAAAPANRPLPGLGGAPFSLQPGAGLGNAPAAGPRPIGPGGAAGLLPSGANRP